MYFVLTVKMLIHRIWMVGYFDRENRNIQEKQVFKSPKDHEATDEVICLPT